MRKKKKNIFIILILTIGVSYILLMGFYINKEMGDNKGGFFPKINTPIDNTTVDKITTFFDDNSVDVLDDLNTFFTSSDQLSNQMKLKYTYYALKDDKVDFETGVSSTKIEAQIKTLLGDATDVIHENIECSKEGHENLVDYDSINDVYKLNKKHKVHNAELVVSNYDYILNFKNNKGKYELLVNKFFVLNNVVYPTYGDAVNRMNNLFTLEKDKEIKTSVTEDYEYLKPFLTEFKYTFIKEKGQIILIKYEKMN